VSGNFNKLISSETERLALLSEEMGEVQQIIGKILRHGYASKHPEDLRGPDNRAMLEKELGDVQAAIKLMWADISFSKVDHWQQEKLKVVGKYLHHQ